MNYDKILELDSFNMIELLTTDYIVSVPESITSIEDMNSASRKLLKLAESYSFVSALLSYAKICVREAKRAIQKENDNKKKEDAKNRYEDLVDKKEIITNISETIKQQYSAISRAVTIHIENNHELNMVAR